MNTNRSTLEELWSRQKITAGDVDYSLWNTQKELLHKFSRMTSSCLFAVDVYKERYDYASDRFTEILGLDHTKIETIARQGDYLESIFHPDDYDQMINMRIKLSEHIYSLPDKERNDYSNIFQFRVLNAKRQYINVISRQRVLLKDNNNKAWIIMGSMDISPDQVPLEHIKCSVLNLKTGEVVSPDTLFNPNIYLTGRETEILQLIQQGLLSKEISRQLNISLNTTNNHRKNILHKLNANNSIEAIQVAKKLRLIS